MKISGIHNALIQYDKLSTYLSAFEQSSKLTLILNFDPNSESLLQEENFSTMKACDLKPKLRISSVEMQAVLLPKSHLLI